MRKIFFLAFVMMSTYQISLAQNSAFGIKGGVNLSNFYTSSGEVDSKDMKTGVHAGFYFRAPIARGLSIQPEATFSMKGARYEYNNNTSAEVRLNYIEVPILAVLHVGDVVQLQAGPYVGFLTNAEYTFQRNNNDSFTDNKRDDYQEIDFGFATGVGFEGRKAEFGVRYSFGIEEVDKAFTIGGLNIQSAELKNSVFQAYIGIKL